MHKAPTVQALQVAELIAACVGNENKSANKTLEVIASNVAPPRTLEEMLEEQPVEITVEELREKQVSIQSMHAVHACAISFQCF